MTLKIFRLLVFVGLVLYPHAPAAGESHRSTPEPTPFLLGGIQTHELDHQRWAAALHKSGMNAVQVTAYAYQGPWHSAKLWYNEDEPAVLNEIRTARQNGLQVVLILRVALDHNEPDNRFLWHGLTYPLTPQATKEWFRTYTDFVLQWARIAEREGVEVLGIASEMNSLAATLPVDDIPHLPKYYLDDEAQQRLRDLVGRSEHLFTDEARLSMGAGDFDDLDNFLVERNRAERVWARAYTFDGSEDPTAAINQRRKQLEGHWRELIQATRKIYSGRLTLAANFDNYHEVAFWDALDFIGINAYFPLRASLEEPLSEEHLLGAWRAVFEDIDDFRKTHELDQSVIFTELGYIRRQGVTVAPWSSAGFIPIWDPNAETENDRAFFWASQPIEPLERALAMRALHRLWADGDSSLAGVLYWKLSSRLELQRYEPFMLHLGKDSGDPLYEAFTRFASDIRPLSPRRPGDDPYFQAVDAIVRDDSSALQASALKTMVFKRSPPAGHPPLLHLAVRLGRTAIAHRLIQSGASLESADAAGFLPIHWSCYQKDPELVSPLMPSTAGPWLDDRRETPLMKCVRLENDPVAQRLIDLGDDLRPANERGWTALHLAVDQASKPMVDLLMQRGGDVDAQDASGNNPLHVAARRGDKDIAAILAKRSKGVTNLKGVRPIHDAAFYAKTDVFHLLFDPSRAMERTVELQTLLHFAAFGGDLDILNTLLPHYSTVDVADDNGWTPLFYAVHDGQTEAVELLLRHGAAGLHRAHDRSTPLHEAAGKSESEVLREILNQKIDPNAVEAKGNTALHYAAGWGRLDNIRLLLAAGADPSRRNQDGQTPFEVATESNRHRAAQLLRDKNTLPNASGDGIGRSQPHGSQGRGSQDLKIR